MTAAFASYNPASPSAPKKFNASAKPKPTPVLNYAALDGFWQQARAMLQTDEHATAKLCRDRLLAKGFTPETIAEHVGYYERPVKVNLSGGRLDWNSLRGYLFAKRDKAGAVIGFKHIAYLDNTPQPLSDAKFLIQDFGKDWRQPHGKEVQHLKSIKYKGSEYDVDSSQPLYGSELVAGAIEKGVPVIVVEGELKALLLRQCGYCAVATGGTAFTAMHAEALTGADAVLMPDSDAMGREALPKWISAGRATVKSLRTLDLFPVNNLDGGKSEPNDFTEFFGLHKANTPAQFAEALARAESASITATERVPNGMATEAPHPKFISASSISSVRKSISGSLVTTDELPHIDIDWLAYGFFAKRRITELVGLPGAGKSLFVQALFQHQDGNAAGITMQGGLKGFYPLGFDMDATDFELRKGIGGAYRLLHNTEDLTLDFNHTEPALAERLEHRNKTGFDLQTDTDKFIKAFRGQGLDAIVFDTKRKFYSGKTNDDETAAKVMTNFKRIAVELNVALILLSHGRKNGAHATTEIIEGTARWAGDCDIVWYIQSGKNSIYRLSNVKRRAFPEPKPLTLKCEFGSPNGFVTTAEAFEVDAPETNAGLLTSSGGADGDEPAERVSETRLDVLRAIAELGSERATPAEISELTGLPKNRIRQHCYQAKRKGEITVSDAGSYSLADAGRELLRLPAPFADSPNARVSLNSPNALTDTKSMENESKTQKEGGVRALGVRAETHGEEASGHRTGILPEPERLSEPVKNEAEKLLKTTLSGAVEMSLNVSSEPVKVRPIETPPKWKKQYVDPAEFFAERLEVHPASGVSMHVIRQNFTGDIGDLRRELARRGVEYHERLEIFQGVRFQLEFEPNQINDEPERKTF